MCLRKLHQNYFFLVGAFLPGAVFTGVVFGVAAFLVAIFLTGAFLATAFFTGALVAGVAFFVGIRYSPLSAASGGSICCIERLCALHDLAVS